MKLYLPTSLNSEIRYWQLYREKRIMPAIREAHSTDLPVFFTLELYGRDYNMPLEVTGYSLQSFEPIAQPSVLKNVLIAKGKDFDPEKVEKNILEYGETVHKASRNIYKLAMHTALHREEYKTSLYGKIIGQLISTPIRREDVGDDTLWLKFIELFYERLKTEKMYEGGSRVGKWLFKRLYRGDILDYINNFAAVIYYEDVNEFFAYTPDNQKLDIQFFDLKKQKELREHKVIRFLKKLDKMIPSSGLKFKDKV